MRKKIKETLDGWTGENAPQSLKGNEKAPVQ